MTTTGIEELEKQLIDLKKKIENLQKILILRQIVLPSDGKIVVPVVTSDPASPTNGQIWYNSTSGTFKCYQNGVVRTFSTV